MPCACIEVATPGTQACIIALCCVAYVINLMPIWQLLGPICSSSFLIVSLTFAEAASQLSVRQLFNYISRVESLSARESAVKRSIDYYACAHAKLKRKSGRNQSVRVYVYTCTYYSAQHCSHLTLGVAMVNKFFCHCLLTLTVCTLKYTPVICQQGT